MVVRRLLIVAVSTSLLLSSPFAAGQTDPFPPASPESQGLSATAVEALARVVQGWVEKENIVGAELLVIRNRRTVLHEAFGWRDRESRARMERNTVFNIRSMTKTLTGAAAQILIDEGKLVPAHPVAKYLEGFANEKSRGITVEQLLTHRSGLPLSILSGVSDYADLETMANAVGRRGPQFEPGSKFWYSDSATDVLGAVVARAAGCPLDAFIARHLLEPLGMEESFCPRDPKDPRWGRIASLYVGGTKRWTRVWRPEGKPFYPFAWGSQSLYCTPRDYARFLAMWLDRGNVGEEQVLSRDAVARTLAPVSPMKQLGSDARFPTGFCDLEAYYGQMAVVHVREGAGKGANPVVCGHSGSDGTIAWAWPDRDLMILYFTQSRGQATALRLEKAIDRLLLHPEKHAKEPAPVPERLRPYLGTYLANFGPFADAEFVVLAENGRLALDIPDQFVFELEEPDAEGKWRFQLDPNTSVAFVRDAQGAVAALKFHSGRHVFELPRGKAGQAPALDPEAVQRYLGFYRDEQAGINVEFVIHAGQLAVKVPNRPLPVKFLPPDDRGRWRLKANPQVSISFQEDGDGRVVSYTVHYPGGTVVRPRVEPAAAKNG